ncbi:MgtC/SapB family protein [Leptospirillum ferriphilum]|jgi:uncharacterized membrane protein (DUF4010 family)|nr:DUF4010 domain-containing protein [Leptospirillum ferriphilum]
MSLFHFLLLIGLSFFLGLAVEEVSLQEKIPGPGGVRTFPVLSLVGLGFFLLDPRYLSVFSVGLLVLGVWLYSYFRSEAATRSHPPSMVSAVSSLLAYLLGPIVIREPSWVSIALVVSSVFFLGTREKLHHLAESVPIHELLTAGKFLLLTGIIFPLLPREILLPSVPVTPYQVWKAVVVVSSLSYASYLAQRFLTPRGSDFLEAILGGFYSSTAATILLSRKGHFQTGREREINAAIILANSLMYIRILLVLLLLRPAIAQKIGGPLLILFGLGVLVGGIVFRWKGRAASSGPDTPGKSGSSGNPLELNSALFFALSYVVISFLTHWVHGAFGVSGVYVLAGVVGFTDIVPFILSLAHPGSAIPLHVILVSTMVAASSNNILKGIYLLIFWRKKAGLPSLLALGGLSAGGVLLVFLFRM